MKPWLLLLGLGCLCLISTGCVRLARAHHPHVPLSAADQTVLVRLRGSEGTAGSVELHETVGFLESEGSVRATPDSDGSPNWNSVTRFDPIILARRVCTLPCEIAFPREVSTTHVGSWLELEDGWRGKLRASQPLDAGHEYVLTPVRRGPRILATVSGMLALIGASVGMMVWDGADDEVSAPFVVGAFMAPISLIGGLLILPSIDTYTEVTEAP